MKRALVFLLLGPASVVFIVWLIYVATGGTPWDFVVAYFALLLFLFTFLVSAIAGLVDGYLARAFPILVRAPLAAIIGSVLAAGLFPFWSGMMLQPAGMVAICDRRRAQHGDVLVAREQILQREHVLAPLFAGRRSGEGLYPHCKCTLWT